MSFTTTKPPQQDRQPGHEHLMHPEPESGVDTYWGSGKLKNKTALITGGDSGIRRAVSIAFAREGADVAIAYLNEHEDAKATKQMVEECGRRCLLISGDIGSEQFCKDTVGPVASEFKKIDILVNNAAEQHVAHDIRDITAEQLQRTFKTNIFSMFYLTKAVLDHMPEGGAIINTASITAYRGHPVLLDYASTKGAIVAFTRSLATPLAEKKIRVNGVAPGPVWTPLIPASFSEEKVAEFGKDNLMGRPGEPAEIAPSYVFLASSDSSFMTGQVLHPNGGEMVNT
jgi:NAD(P)-dependent dehydrogenase (short-subunit alcohol dehydrogenase family)